MTLYIGDIPISYVSSFNADRGSKNIEEIAFIGEHVVPYLSESNRKLLDFEMNGTLLQESGMAESLDDLAERILAIKDRRAPFNYINNFQSRSGWVGLKEAGSDKNAHSLVTRPYNMEGKFLPKNFYQLRTHSSPVILTNDFSLSLGAGGCDNYIPIPIGGTYSGGDDAIIFRVTKDGTITLVKATTDNDINWDPVGDEVDIGECKVWDDMDEASESDWVRIFNQDHVFTGDQVVENGIIRLKIAGVFIDVYTYDGSTYQLTSTVEPEAADGTLATLLNAVSWKTLNPDRVKIVLKYNNVDITLDLLRGLPYAEMSPSVAAFAISSTKTEMCIPSDYANIKLPSWNQKLLFGGGPHANPWNSREDYSVAVNWRYVADTIINLGTDVKMHSIDWTTVKDKTVLTGNSPTYLNWILDKVNHKYSYEFYLDNQLEKVDETVINNCDATTDWANGKGTGTLANDTGDKQEGTGSLYTTNGQSDGSGYRTYEYNPAAVINLSSKEFLEFWIKSDLAGQVYVKITDNQGTPAYKKWDDAARFTVGAATWTRFVLPILAPQGSTGSLPSTVSGTIDLANIDKIEIGVRGVTVSSACDIWVDDVCGDVGQWIKVETFVPDELDNQTFSVSGIKEHISLFSWDNNTSTYKEVNIGPIDSGNYYMHGGGAGSAFGMWHLDGGSHKDIYGLAAVTLSKMGIYSKGLKEGIASLETTLNHTSTPTTITYSTNYGVKQRVGFALKMPPSDGKQSSTTGISQCKLKLEVYYDDINGTTVKDLSGYGNHGTIDGASKVDGKIDDGWEFSADGQLISVPHSDLLNITGSITIGAWVDLDVVNILEQGIVQKRDSNIPSPYVFRIGGNTLRFGFYGSDGWENSYSTTSLTTGVHFLMVVYDALTKTGVQYIDNVNVDDFTFTGIALGNTLPLTIGYEQGYAKSIDGVLSDVFIYSKAISSAKRTEIYNSGTGIVLDPSEETDLVLYLRGLQEHWGAATYEFSPDTDSYTGLENMNDCWIGLLDIGTDEQMSFLASPNKPTGLEITADEDEALAKIHSTFSSIPTIKVGVFDGNTESDGDADNIPDVFEDTSEKVPDLAHKAMVNPRSLRELIQR